MKVHVEVTAEDIATGEPSDYSQCPIALALKRAVPGCDPYVSTVLLSLNGRHGIQAFIPTCVSMFIMDFDDGDPVDPFAFDLEIPDGTLAGTM